MLIDTGITIDGTDISDLISDRGVDWSSRDKEGPNGGTTLSGLTVRDRLATKVQLDVSCRKITLAQMRLLVALLLPEFVTVAYDDPAEGPVSKTMYAQERRGRAERHATGETVEEYYSGVTFTLYER